MAPTNGGSTNGTNSSDANRLFPGNSYRLLRRASGTVISTQHTVTSVAITALLMAPIRNCWSWKTAARYAPTEANFTPGVDSPSPVLMTVHTGQTRNTPNSTSTAAKAA